MNSISILISSPPLLIFVASQNLIRRTSAVKKRWSFINSRRIRKRSIAKILGTLLSVKEAGKKKNGEDLMIFGPKLMTEVQPLLVEQPRRHKRREEEERAWERKERESVRNTDTLPRCQVSKNAPIYLMTWEAVLRAQFNFIYIDR